MICCEELLREISSYIDEEITADLRGQIESHLCACRHCKIVVDTTKKTLTLVADDSFLELPQGVSERLLARLTKHCSSR
jgi:anti-sigma factor RsiW